MAYFEHLFILICIYTILSQSLNIVMGYTGLFNLGQVAFYGVGAYTSALLTLAGYPFWLGLICGAILASLSSLLIGIPSLRLKGHYFAIATLGFGEIARSVMLNWTSLTRGPMGLPGIPRPELFGYSFSSMEAFLVFALIAAVICNFSMYLIIKSHFGRVLKSIREDEIAAEALGKNITKYKIQSLMVGAFFAGIAGSLYAHYINFIDPSTFVLQETILITLMVVVGGMGSFLGTILGATILILLPEPLRMLDLPSSIVAPVRLMIYALLLILIMLFKPDGIIHPEKFQFNLFRKWKKR